MFGRLPLTLVSCPTGRWEFVGTVPVALKFRRKDGQPMSRDDYQVAATANVPSLLGYVTRTYATKREALNAARELGVRVDDVGR